MNYTIFRVRKESPSTCRELHNSKSDPSLIDLDATWCGDVNVRNSEPHVFTLFTLYQGKTATFAIGTLAKLDNKLRECQSLILAPTRELAQQIQKVVIALGDYMDVQVHACVGGTAVRDDIRTLQGGVHVVVGTPGRVYDMINRRALRLDSIKQFFLDEADEMLSRGFKDQIIDIFKFLPDSVQVCLFSATMPLDVLEVTQ